MTIFGLQESNVHKPSDLWPVSIHWPCESKYYVLFPTWFSFRKFLNLNFPNWQLHFEIATSHHEIFTVFIIICKMLKQVVWAQLRNQRNVSSFSFKRKHDFIDLWGGRHAKPSKYQDSIQGSFLRGNTMLGALCHVQKFELCSELHVLIFWVTNSLWWQCKFWLRVFLKKNIFSSDA